MKKRSAGLLMLKEQDNQIWFFIVHPGGPFWKSRNNGAWTIPKGKIESGESPLQAAQREWVEETGFIIPAGPYHPLSPVYLQSGKQILSFAVKGDVNPNALKSNTFSMEYPKHSGQHHLFPEIDEGKWCTYKEASTLLNQAFVPLLHQAQTAFALLPR